MKKRSLFLLFQALLGAFCRGGERFSEDHDARTGVVGLDFVQLDAVAPFGTYLAVDDSLHVAVAWIAAAVDDPQYLEACNHQVIDAPLDGFRRLVRGHAVEVDFIFGYGQFPGAGVAAHLAPAQGARGTFGGVRFGFFPRLLVLIFHVVVLDPLELKFFFLI